MPVNFGLLPYLLALITTTALPAPATAQSISNLIQTTDLLNNTFASPITCFPNPPGRAHVTPPSFQKCGLALRQLPTTETIGPFHHGGPFDQYSLPVTKNSGPCQIVVEAANGGMAKDRASWLGVGLAAVQLAMACTPVTDAGYGGTTLTGQADGIMITIRSTQRVGNASDTTATS